MRRWLDDEWMKRSCVAAADTAADIDQQAACAFLQEAETRISPPFFSSHNISHYGDAEIGTCWYWNTNFIIYDASWFRAVPEQLSTSMNKDRPPDENLGKHVLARLYRSFVDSIVRSNGVYLIGLLRVVDRHTLL